MLGDSELRRMPDYTHFFHDGVAASSERPGLRVILDTLALKLDVFRRLRSWFIKFRHICRLLEMNYSKPNRKMKLRNHMLPHQSFAVTSHSPQLVVYEGYT